MIEDGRDPNAFLSRLEEEGAKEKRGRLKIFFGFVAGVGKTYAMLETAHKLQKDGIDVVIGYIETHGRQATAALLEGLDVLPVKNVEYRGTVQSEFDVDGALARRPQVILVDELAHTNVQGSRHTKRWQDIEELLQAGIDVHTTLNVQHIESLHDVISQITQVAVQERVPDRLIEKAAEIELIDLPPDELIERLREGKIYVPAKVEEALSNFFRKGNLIALRELALRIAAERVEAQMEQYRLSYSIRELWPTSEKILVAVSPSPLSIRLIRAAKRMAARLKAKWLVAYVETPSQVNLPQEAKNRVIQTLRLAEQLGAETIELTGNSVSDSLIKCARQANCTRIVIGKPAGSKIRELLFGSVVNDLIRSSGNIDISVITGEESHTKQANIPVLPRRYDAVIFLKAAGIVVLSSIVARLMFRHFELSNIVMSYMLGVVFVAVRYGKGPSIFASVLSVASFDFFCVPPYMTFAVSDTEYVVTFIVMLVVGLVVSTLTATVKVQAQSATLREQRTTALYLLSRELSSTLNMKDLVEIGLSHISELFSSQVAWLQPSASGKLTVLAGVTELGNHSQSVEPDRLVEEKQKDYSFVDEGVAQWSFRNGLAAGHGTNTLPAAQALYIPLLGSEQAIGILAIKSREPDRFASPEQLHLLETFANQIAVACERAHLSEENERTQLQIKTEQLRSSLLSSVSHDLRTPLATITGAASSILEGSDAMDIAACKEMANEIYKESARLNRLVKNLLDMTRVESGTLSVKKELHPIEEIIGAALNLLDEQLASRTVTTNLPEIPPMVPLDPILTQQLLYNLLENAIKYSADGIELSVSVDGQNCTVSVADHGPGIADDQKKLIFQKFHRADTGQTSGVGLGLAICHGIVAAHDGKLWVEDRPKGTGAVFKFSFPIQAESSNKVLEKPKSVI